MIASCIHLQLSIVIFLNRLFQTCIIVKGTCISIYSKVGLVDQSIAVHTNISVDNRKLHKFATCNLNFETKPQLAELFA